ncbi:hypothetical protein QM787_25490 [Rhodococcus ruber]|uniref:Uncharacterized protein n=1 Tax=Rhodococcus ruber TaxID=1830 RepID=A0A098BN42_9NOCA|nr:MULTISPECIES: hypothetical protein [Rhodococcus]AUM19281.1 hypothetical protein CSW53_23765 [Rhodococcus ruber]AXY49739.1 hypothetical protein YT1_0282 [Rhodococcus ruber]MBD8057293.1 hypothetical protein [Rhodococcus ruber]MCD2129923.1 hypothetical protein [Rhodococcus ruber]MCF8784615.1 hypothetical protein [Rhodococcus ruber]
MSFDEQLHRAAFDLARAGHSWREVGAELGCDETVARAMARRYEADTEARARADQFSLFEL